jgi:hypothetical protein
MEPMRMAMSQATMSYRKTTRINMRLSEATRIKMRTR